MTTRTLTVTVPVPAAQVAERLADDIAFPGYAEDIVAVSDAGDGRRAWVLAFRGGVARWLQHSRRTGGDGEPYRIEFEQVSGDFQDLRGGWTVTSVPDGSQVVYEVGFRTSVPHLAGAIDSAVGRVLVRSAHDIVSALGPVRVTGGGHFLRDLIS
ncbi:type II toxin-antitoxin system RatA family toxin [Krasilnikovia sp. MM14-A1259]|uniref:type II toxin-antitoxin system RatA family toxin n=1 Tax=Krasilnikovia sp. MM14-A1259 TaxID=3373539 RepID=UPI00382684B7